jgi:hypothetical protein
MPEPDVPEFYVDQFTVSLGAFGGAMTFGLTAPHPAPGQMQPPKDIVRLRMSLEHAKIMAMILRRQVKAFEEQFGVPINIPRQVYNGLGISQEDW